MKRTFLILAAVLALVAVGVVAYVLRPPAQASAPIQATPVAIQTQVAPTQAQATPTQAQATPTQAEVVETQESPQPTPTPEAQGSAATGGPSGTIVYQIIQDESQVRFSIDEILRGNPFTAVGATNQVAGEIAVDFDHGTAQVGVIQVNARTLKTDNSYRDRAINNEILDTGIYEYITFEPTDVRGLPTSFNADEAFTFQITGNLTIRDVTQEITFDAMVTPISIERMQGYASATVLRSDYNLTIPSVPQVANVSEEVLLEIEFVAVSK